MATTTTSIEAELRELEQRYWEATLKPDSAEMKRLTAGQFTFVMPAGVNEFKREDFITMMTAGDFKLTSYEFDPELATVRELGRDAALITYRVKWTYDRSGTNEATDTYYTSIWVREDGEWKYAAACESPLEK